MNEAMSPNQPTLLDRVRDLLQQPPPSGQEATWTLLRELQRRQLELEYQVLDINSLQVRYRAIGETARDGFLIVDRKGRILASNDAYVRLSGYGRDALLKMKIEDLEALDTPDQIGEYGRNIMQRGNALFETRHRRKDGSEWPVEVNISYSPIDGGIFFGFLRDITERKTLQREIIKISTAEQERIGREIHDGVGQQLTGLTMLCKSLAQRLQAVDRPEEAVAAGRLHGYAQKALDEIHRLARGLAPVEISDESLPRALQNLAEDVSVGSGIDCRFHRLEQLRLPDSDISGHLFRIAQEALQNAVKHAEAEHILMLLASEPDNLVLTVLDDGRGMRPTHEREGGLGLHIMGYRAGIIGGRLVIGPAGSGGTLVRCEVPLRD